MRTREDYDRAVAIVASLVREWDPYRLLAEGAPPNEFEAQIARIVTHVPRISNAREAARVLSSVFSQAFGPDTFGVEACAHQGRLLHARLVQAGLVHA